MQNEKEARRPLVICLQNAWMLFDECPHLVGGAAAVAYFAPRAELSRVFSTRLAHTLEVEGVVCLRIVFVELAHMVVDDRTIVGDAIAPEVLAIGIEASLVLEDRHACEDEIPVCDDERTLELARMDISKYVARTTLRHHERLAIGRHPREDVFDHADFEDLASRKLELASNLTFAALTMLIDEVHVFPAGLFEISPEAFADASSDLPSEIAFLGLVVAAFLVEDERGFDGAVHVRAVAPVEVGELRAEECADRDTHIRAFFGEPILRMGNMPKQFTHVEGVTFDDLMDRFVGDRRKVTNENQISSRAHGHVWLLVG